MPRAQRFPGDVVPPGATADGCGSTGDGDAVQSPEVDHDAPVHLGLPERAVPLTPGDERDPQITAVLHDPYDVVDRHDGHDGLRPPMNDVAEVLGGAAEGLLVDPDLAIQRRPTRHVALSTAICRTVTRITKSLSRQRWLVGVGLH